jgi:hypothetical protein
VDNRALLSEMPVIDSFLEAIVDSIPAGFYRTQPGIHVCITVSERSLPNVASEFVIKLVQMENRLFGDFVVGRIVGSADEQGYTSDSWPIVEDQDLRSFVLKASYRFWNLIDNFANWPSFSSFLLESISYDVENQNPNLQFPYEYWWLTGSLDESDLIHEVGLYEDIGVFIRPNDHILPLFSSRLFADMAAHKYSKKHAFNLESRHIQCLGCYLNGFTGEIGREVVRGALLNEQWEIQFYTCDESPSHETARHFFLMDGAIGSYTLFKCKEDGPGPIWCEKRWDFNYHFFDPACNLVKW